MGGGTSSTEGQCPCGLVTAGRPHNPPGVAARLICTSDGGHATPAFPGTASSSGRNIVITARLLARPPGSGPAPARTPRSPADGRPEQAGAAGGPLERYPELPGNTVSCVLPGPFALVSEDATDGGDATARQSTASKRPVMACSPAASGTRTRTRHGSTRCTPDWWKRSSTGCPTRPGSTPGTEGTQRSGPSGRI